MNVHSYPCHSFLFKLPNKRMNFPFPPLKLPNKGNEEYSKIIHFIPLHFIPSSQTRPKGTFGAKEDEERVYSYHLPLQSPLLSLHLSPSKHKVKELLRNFSEILLGMVYCLNFFQKFYFLVMQGSNPLYKLQKCINKSYQPYLLKDSLHSLLFNFRCKRV